MVTQDLLLVVGLVIAGFAIPSIMGAIADRRSPRAAAIAIMIGGSLVVLAYTQRPGGYSLEEVPEAFVRVVAHFLR
ncbi:MAG: hypothetical protein QNJ16_04545 [Rhodobacter sp.]|nr:hypothetical protein [Rhodobacter sp.]